MLFAYLRSNLLLASLVVFTILGSSSSTRFKLTFEGWEVSHICEDTLDPEFCEHILFSNPLTAESDIPGLGKFLVQYGQHNITNAVNQIQSSLQNITDPQSKKIYTDCVEHLKWSSTYCDNSLEALAAKDKSHFIGHILNAQRWGDDCGDSLKSRDYDSELVKKIDVFHNVIDIAVELGNMLP